MREPKLPRKGLTPEAFEALLHRLDPDDRERAGELYKELDRRLVSWFERRGCNNPEDLADETLDRVGRRLAEGVDVQSDLFNYACGVAQLVYKESLRDQDKKRKARDLELPLLQEWPPDPEGDRRLDCLRSCLERLPPDQRLLILKYHDVDDRIQGRQELARELGIEMNALRIRAHRVRKELRTCVQRCLSVHRH